MTTVLWTSQAEADLSEIFAYIAVDDLAAAEQTLRRIGAKCDGLADNPGIGRGRPDLHETLRSFPVGNYVIFYRAVTGGIEVVRVLHGARDIDRLFE